ncbi:MAG: glycoside hydrolase family 76 protein [Corynebacterium sp.]|nr:glycoside hydrolase family 76 protein [Corynebacterium sp.]
MQDKWAHRADLAESAVNERHAHQLWSIPHTNLGVIAWPATTRDELFLHWHYWWQAHYLDCLVDALERRSTKIRRSRVHRTMRTIRMRNLRSLTHNRYNDDKAWLALAMGRTIGTGVRTPGSLKKLEFDLLSGVDPVLGVLPWKTGEHFYNVPANGPFAIMAARTGRVDVAVNVLTWMTDNLIGDDGLVADGIRLRVSGPELVSALYPYNQGTLLGASLEVALALRDMAGTTVDASGSAPLAYDEAESAASYMPYILHIRRLIDAISTHLATRSGVITWHSTGGDGGLFNGILARYIADVAVRLPADSPANVETRRKAAKLIVASAESVWTHRLEVDGLPVFGARWDADAQLPRGAGPISETRSLLTAPPVFERDFSVQLSGWMLMEAAARIEREGGLL